MTKNNRSTSSQLATGKMAIKKTTKKKDTWQEEVEQALSAAERMISNAEVEMNDLFCILDDTDTRRTLTKEQWARVDGLTRDCEQFMDDNRYLKDTFQ